MRKRVLSLSFVAILLTSIVLAASLGHLHAPAAHSAAAIASTDSSDPIVVVVVDATNLHGPCIQKQERYVGTPQYVVTTHPCQPWSIATRAYMPRSQALASHLQYVVLPGPNASSAERQQVEQQIDMLFYNVRPDKHLGAMGSNQASTGANTQPGSCTSGVETINSWAPWYYDVPGNQSEQLWLSVDYQSYYPCASLHLNYSDRAWIQDGCCPPPLNGNEGDVDQKYTDQYWRICSPWSEQYPNFYRISLNVNVAANYYFVFDVGTSDTIQQGCGTDASFYLGTLW